MRICDFPARITPEGNLEVPEQLAELLRADETVRVIVVGDEDSAESEVQAWSRLAAEQLLAQYSDADAIYDSL